MTPETEIFQRCSYILPKKKRSCRMLVKSGNLYCGEHAIFDPINKDRIPCPNDPKHTVLIQDLEEHLKLKCNSRLLEEPWLKQNINVDISMPSSKHGGNGKPSDELLKLVADIICREYEIENPDLEVTRLRCPVEHLDLSQVEFLKNCEQVIAVCKHFCGSATDFGIRSIANGISNNLRIGGFVLTPCCHHRCEYSQYVGRDYLRSIGMENEDDFEALRHISTWATCGFQRAEENGKDEAKIWTVSQKEELGRKAKVLLEIGRVAYLKNLEMDVFVGCSTGAFKTLNLQNSTFYNVTPTNSLDPKQHEITAMCFSDKEQTEILVAQFNRQLKLFNSLQGTYTDLFVAQGGGVVKGLEITKDENIITAFESGDIRLWENRGNLVSSTINAGPQIRVMTKKPTEEIIATGGLENPLKIWDLTTGENTFVAKNVRPDFLELRVPVNVTNARFLGDTGRIVTTTGTHHIRIYDPRAQRRPIHELEWLDEPIHALSLCNRPEHVIVGNTKGDMSLFDLRGKINPIHKYRGFAGAIRSIDAHPTAPYVVSCGVDRIVRVHEVNTKKLLKKIYCKVRMNCILLKKKNSLVNPEKPPKTKSARGSDEEEEDSEAELVNSEDETLWKEMKTVGTKRKRKHEDE
uniref:tRNA:m(4)X modification enzyme TRM13 n=1 Tax=Acrobeloides nanus TaxID=290746 RepID=A0A914CRI0_9BILA